MAQTGVQLLTGLLLTVPFQSRFTDLTAHDRIIYLVTVSLSVLATGLRIAPVVLHRMLFRLHARRVLVSTGQRCALAGFTTLGCAVVGVCALIFDVVTGPVGGWTAGIVALLVFATLWLVGPLVLRRRSNPSDDEV